MEVLLSNFTFIAETMKILFEHERKRFKSRLHGILKEFYAMEPNSDGFYFNNQFYTNAEVKGVGTNRMKKSQIPDSLVPKMEDALQDFVNFNNHRHKINQALVLVLMDASNKQEIRDSLPDCLVEFLPEYSKMPRMNEEAFLIKDNKLKYEQYLKIRPLIELYTATKYLY